MRIVITGGAGFLGSHLCEKLLKLGHAVCCIDNLVTGRRENIQAFERQRRFEFLLQDVSSHIDVEGPVDAVLHFASPASPVDYHRLQIQTMKVGALGTHKALGLVRAKGARFLLASTSEVYGDPQVSPQREDYWGNVNPVGPRGVYDEAKRFAEALTLAYHRCHGLDVRIARIFNTYGPRMRIHDGRVVSNFIVQALQGKNLTVYGDGMQTRSLCYVNDLVEGLIRLLLMENAAEGSASHNGAEDVHGPVNLGNPVEMTVMDIAKLVLSVTGSSSHIERLPLPPDDPKVRCPDITRAQKLLNWKPETDPETGIKQTTAYFRSIIAEESTTQMSSG
jgi:dTDP-glucose 4,6-dehydratase